MSVTVTTQPQIAPATSFGAVGDPQNPPEPEPKSPLAHLKRIREQMESKLYIDLKVPRWGSIEGSPEIYVRYGPVDNEVFESIVERRSKQGGSWALAANAEMLVHCCQGVYAVVDGDTSKKFSLADAGDATEEEQLKKPWTRFDQALGTALGLPPARMTTAADICQELYLTDGDLLAAASAVADWSGVESERLTENFTAS